MPTTQAEKGHALRRPHYAFDLIDQMPPAFDLARPRDFATALLAGLLAAGAVMALVIGLGS